MPPLGDRGCRADFGTLVVEGMCDEEVVVGALVTSEDEDAAGLDEGRFGTTTIGFVLVTAEEDARVWGMEDGAGTNVISTPPTV